MTRHTYQQCRLRRLNTEQVSFLPQQFAVVGRVLRLKQDDGTWQDGWVVANVHGQSVPPELLSDPHNAIKAHRKATGDSVSRPKQ
jgi:hypothetical protein